MFSNNKHVLSLQTSRVEEFPTILWAYHITTRTTTGEAPFSLAYEVEALIPAEIGPRNHHVQPFDDAAKQEGMALHLDWPEEEMPHRW